MTPTSGETMYATTPRPPAPAQGGQAATSAALAARSRYATASVQTASPARLLTMLYDRLVRDLDEGERFQAAGERERANAALQHAQDIVHELRSTLDLEVWDGAERLNAIYGFLLGELVQANIARDPARTAACRHLVEPLREAWHAAALEVLAETPAESGAAGRSGTSAG